MKRHVWTIMLLVVATSWAGSASGAGRSRDETEILDVQARQAEAWNRHDAKAYAELFTTDGDVVNVVGWWWKGRVEIEAKLTDAFAFTFRDSVLTIEDVDIRFLTSRIAIARVHWTMTGAKTPPGIPEPRNGIEIQVLRKQAGKWLIVAFQNTNILPEIPFPKAPPAATSSKAPTSSRN